MASSLFLLLDDIASVLDDVATMTKVATKKTAGVLGDDLALNAEQVTGLHPEREIPIVLAVAKGSFINKLILVPSALAISAVLPLAIKPLLMIGGAYLCFEGFEKVFVHKKEKHHPTQDNTHPEFELSKIRGAIRTDFILSAEIIVISLGTVGDQSLSVQAGVLSAVALLMTVGVYGLVAGIVKLDDFGLRLIRKPKGSRARVLLGQGLLQFAPKLMHFLSIAGTAAMFLVGGGIFAHALAPIESFLKGQGFWVELLVNAGLGLLVGALCVTGLLIVQRLTGARNRV